MTHYYYLFLLLLFTVLEVISVLQPTCDPVDTVYEGSCESFAGTPDLCIPHLSNHSIFVPQGYTQISIFVKKYEFFIPFISWIDDLSKDPDEYAAEIDCLRQLSLWGCTLVFPPCKNDTETGYGFPMPVCKKSCENLLDICERALANQEKLRNSIICEDCPEEQETTVLTNGTYGFKEQESDCYDMSGQISCYYPLSDEGREVYIGCGMVCPYPNWSEDEWDTIKGLTLGLSIISCLATSTLLITFFISPQKRKFPNNLPAFLILSSFGLSFSYLLEAMIGFEDVWCKEERVCTFQGVLVMFFLLSISTWWFSICCNIFLSTIIEIPQKAEYEKFYHLYSWGVPFLFSIIFLSLDLIVYSFGENTCDIIAPVSTETPWERILGYYIPIGFHLVCGTLMISSVFIKMFQISSDFKTLKKLLSNQIRILLFLFLFMIIQGFFFGYHLDRTLQTEDVFTSNLIYLNCIQTSKDPNTCKDASTFNYGAFILSIFASAGQGIVFFGLFGSSLSSFKSFKDKVLSTVSKGTKSQSHENTL